MECLTKDIARDHHYCVPAKCAACPVYQSGEYDCFRGVDELLGDVVYETAGGRITVKAGFCFDGGEHSPGRLVLTRASVHAGVCARSRAA